ncbi:unnamed protein product, partial [Hapterophycus canaliculatus]
MMVLRALSLGARSAEREVATHALQLLTKALLDELSEGAPSDVLQDVMLSMVLPVARQVWRQEARSTAAWGSRTRRQQRQQRRQCSGDESSSRNGSGVGGSGIGGSGPGGDGGSSASAEAARREEEGEEDDFEMVEVPDESGRSPESAGAAGAETPALRRQSSGRRARGDSQEGFDDDGPDGEDGGGGGGPGGGDVGLQQLSSPALLALLLVLKSFLKHLSFLRRGTEFCEVWRQFLRCLKTLLGSEGSAPPTLVDGAVAGLGAVLGEMHREGLFAAAASPPEAGTAAGTGAAAASR